MTNNEIDGKASAVSEPRRAELPRSSAFDAWLAGRILRGAGNPDMAIVLWDGRMVCGSAGQAADRILIRDRSTLLRFLTNSSLAFGDGYTSGRLEVLGDLRRLLMNVYEKSPTAGPPSFWSWLRGLLPWTNPLSRARDNIHRHYDLGNDFYRLWLDEQMVYTCAYFPEPSCSLEDAQRAKMEHVSRKLWLRPGETVVEAGCGWGALALHMARHHGVKVRAFNISHEQIAYARETASREGLADRVEFIEDDFRNITGQYDAFVSVGMLEHVHPRNYAPFGQLIKRCLKPSGRGLIHSIGFNQPRPADPWLERRIFPGAHIPGLREALTILEGQNFSVLDVENLRLHYARTLDHWLNRFEAVADQVEAKFDAAFVRAWRLYLASSMTSFLTGIGQLFQIVFAPARNDDIPATRAHHFTASGQHP